MAELARDEEAWWTAEIARLAPEILLSGRPVRGGGRAAAEGVALDLHRLAGLVPAVQRRLLRHAASRLGATLDFPATESLRQLALTGRAGQKCELAAGLRAERSHRELRLSIQPAGPAVQQESAPAGLSIPIPGQADSPEFSIRVTIESDQAGSGAGLSPSPAILRTWRPGDRVHLRHSSGPRKVKEVLERMKVTGAERARWPVLEINGRILWMRGVALEPEPGIRVTATPLELPAAPIRDTPPAKS